MFSYLINKIAAILMILILTACFGFFVFVLIDQALDAATGGAFDLMDIRCDLFGITEMCPR